MTTAPALARVVRIEVSAAPGHADPIGDGVVREAGALGVALKSARATHVYLIEPEDGELSEEQVEAVRGRLLTDPVIEASRVGASPAAEGAVVVEVHPLPGVMDPVAQSVQGAIKELLSLAHEPRVSTGWRYDLVGASLDGEKARGLASRLLANPVIQRVHTEAYVPERLPRAAAHDSAVRRVTLTTLTDAELEKLSREAHLFLSLDEMRAVRDHYKARGEEPAEIELETLAQTWSEHCVHKTLKSTIRYRNEAWGQGAGGGAGVGGGASPSDSMTGVVAAPTGPAANVKDRFKWTGRPGHEVLPDGTVLIRNLLKSTVAAATHALIADGVDWTLSVFSDNSGVIAFDEQHAVCVKVETHNHPSAIEPYGGAATGVGGCIRDVIGTGLGARPIANTDVFCVAHPTLAGAQIPGGCLPPKRILSQVVAGVRDYGNRMGIPTVAGAVAFDNRYVGNPLVFCGCVGVMKRDRTHGEVRPGDLIVALGGRTGRDGIHGATFSSAELEHSASDEFAHAVQIGNAITEKQVLDAISRASEYAEDSKGRRCLFSGLTDCGAGGFSSAIGEMGKSTGAIVHLDKAPLKYPGLSATEIWISEAQERMVLAVPAANLPALRTICAEESVELAVLGEFSAPPGSEESDPDLQLLFNKREIGRLSMTFLHEGIPTPQRDAVFATPRVSMSAVRTGTHEPPLVEALTKLLAHPNIASKHWIVRQYDHEVRGGTVVKPLVGPGQRGPGNGSVVTPVAGSTRGLAIACGLQTPVGDPVLGGDPYLMVLAAVDECVRNLVCLGADPARTAILDNFCWPSCKKPENLGSLVRAAEGCHDAALAYRTPFVSGKDSLNNQFTTQDGRTIEIPPTLLITGIGIVHDVHRACTMDAKRAGNVLVCVGGTDVRMGGSHYQMFFGLPSKAYDAEAGKAAIPAAATASLLKPPTTNLTVGPLTARLVAGFIAEGKVRSAHDVSDGGLLCAVAEMLIAGSVPSSPLGAQVDLSAVPAEGLPTPRSLLAASVAAFSETPSRYLLELTENDWRTMKPVFAANKIPAAVVAVLNGSGLLDVTERLLDPVPVSDLAKAWSKPLDW
jgi:phosphoribosylformylglycinamidine synthase subunit PurSL